MSWAPWWATSFPASDLPHSSPAKRSRQLTETHGYVQACVIPPGSGYACHHNHNIIVDAANLVFQKVSRWPSKCTEINGTIIANKSQLWHFLRCSKLRIRIFLCHFYFFLHQEAGVFRQSRTHFKYLKVHVCHWNLKLSKYESRAENVIIIWRIIGVWALLKKRKNAVTIPMTLKFNTLAKYTEYSFE